MRSGLFGEIPFVRTENFIIYYELFFPTWNIDFFCVRCLHRKRIFFYKKKNSVMVMKLKQCLVGFVTDSFLSISFIRGCSWTPPKQYHVGIILKSYELYSFIQNGMGTHNTYSCTAYNSVIGAY